ncbi:hypothetical protein GBA52_004756 [Prunus armeniaca]|nr:hypothetical protein GBA52_004756 [Prunus armeniaca]
MAEVTFFSLLPLIYLYVYGVWQQRVKNQMNVSDLPNITALFAQGEWIERWDEQRENGSFPGPL